MHNIGALIREQFSVQYIGSKSICNGKQLSIFAKNHH